MKFSKNIRENTKGSCFLTTIRVAANIFVVEFLRQSREIINFACCEIFLDFLAKCET